MQNMIIYEVDENESSAIAKWVECHLAMGP